MGCCCSKNHHKVEMSDELKAEKKRLKKAVLAELTGADTSGDGNVSIDELREFLLRPAVRSVLNELAGDATETHAQFLAETLMRRFDVNGSGSLDKTELRALQEELTRCITEPFYVFLGSTTAAPGGTVWGMAVLELSSPLCVGELCVELEGMSVCNFSVPKTHTRTVYRNGKRRTERYTVYHPKSSRERILSGRQVLFAPPDGVLQPGLHRFRFTFNLPNPMVNSVEMPKLTGKSPQGNGKTSQGSASVSYRVCAATTLNPTAGIVEGMDRHAKNASAAAFTVDSQVDPAVLEVRVGEPMKVSTGVVRSKPCCCCCCMKGDKLPSYQYQNSLMTSSGIIGPRVGMAPRPGSTVVYHVGGGDEIYSELQVTNLGVTDVDKVFMRAGVQSRVRLSAQGCDWNAVMKLSKEDSDTLAVPAGQNRTFSLRTTVPTLAARRIMQCYTQSISMTTEAYAVVKASTPSCVSWTTKEVGAVEPVAYVRWSRKPHVRNEFRSAPSESKVEDDVYGSHAGWALPSASGPYAEALFGTAATSVTKTHPSAPIMGHAGGVAAPSAPPAFNDVYSYPPPPAYNALAVSQMVEGSGDDKKEAEAGAGGAVMTKNVLL